MVAAPRSVLTVAVAGALLLAACGDGAADGAAPAAPTSAVVPSTSPSTTSTTLPPATVPPTTATTLPSTTTTARPVQELTGRIGEAIAFEVPRPTAPFFEGGRPVWLVPTGQSTVQAGAGTAGLLAVAAVVRGASVTVQGVVPRTFAVRGREVTFRAVTPGRYEIVSAGAVLASVSVDGMGRATPVDATPVRTERELPAAVFQDDALAGVVFGEREQVALQWLVERFGPPDADTGRYDFCGAAYLPARDVRWGGLTVRFSAWSEIHSAPEDTVLAFGAYHYVASDRGPQGLRTGDGVGLGAPASVVIARPTPERQSFNAPYLKEAITQWWDGPSNSVSTTPGFGVRFDRDVTFGGDAPVVTAIASASSTGGLHFFNVC